MERTRQIVHVRSGGVIDELSGLFLGRVVGARDGTYLWEVFSNGTSLLSPIAVDREQKAIHIDDQGFLPAKEQMRHE
jgi:hypothetical protein